MNQYYGPVRTAPASAPENLYMKIIRFYFIQESHGYNSDKTLTITALSVTELKRILLSFKT